MSSSIAIMISDLSGYTALTDVHGAEAAASQVDRMMQLVDMSLVGDSRLHQRVGDQVVIVSSSAENLAYTAIFLFERVYEQEKFLPMHAGLHYGPILEKDNNYFGSTINATARIMSNAEKGKILCSGEFIAELPKGDSFVFKELGKKQFKNLLQPVDVFELSCCIANISRVYVIDPVCHLLIKEPQKALHLNHSESTQYFCSEKCRNLYREINRM